MNAKNEKECQNVGFRSVTSISLSFDSLIKQNISFLVLQRREH